MVLWDEIGLCRKTVFQAPIFFSHMLVLLPIHEAGPCNSSDKLRGVIVKGRVQETKKTTVEKSPLPRFAPPTFKPEV